MENTDKKNFKSGLGDFLGSFDKITGSIDKLADTGTKVIGTVGTGFNVSNTNLMNRAMIDQMNKPQITVVSPNPMGGANASQGSSQTPFQQFPQVPFMQPSPPPMPTYTPQPRYEAPQMPQIQFPMQQQAPAPLPLAKDNSMLYIGLGVGAFVLVGLGLFMAMKK